MHRRQTEIIEFQDAQIRSLLQKSGKKRILLNHDQRRLLTVKGNSIALLKAHWDGLAAIDFTTVEVWTKDGLVTFYLLCVMGLKTRRVHLATCTPTLGDDFMKQIARNLSDPFDGFLKDKKYVLMDRDRNFGQAFQGILEGSDVHPVRLPSKSPDLNAHLQRFHLSIKSECLSRRIFFGQTSLRRAVTNYLEHYHVERNHQALGNEIIEPRDEVGDVAGKIGCCELLGAILNYYYRDAA